MRCAATFLFALFAIAPAASTLADPLHAVCMVDRVLLAAGERVGVSAFTDAPAGVDVQVAWSADGGDVVPSNEPGQAVWSPAEQSHGVFVISARIRAASGETGDCSVEVAVTQTPNRGGGEALDSRRALLLRDENEAPDYGLYSYVLFAARPTDQEIDLYDAILKNYLALLPTQEELERRWPERFPHRSLNIAYVPVTREPPDDFDQLEIDDQFAWIRNYYDYTRAFVMLSSLRALPDADRSLSSGTAFIVSCQHPLDGKQDPRPGFQQDLSTTPVSLIPAWMRIFALQTTQPRDYNRYSVSRLNWDLRVAIAHGGESLKAVTAAIKMLGGAE